MTDADRQEEFEEGGEPEEAHVPPVHGDPEENPEELEEHLEETGEKPAPPELSPVEPEVALEAQDDTYDPGKQEEPETEREAVEEAAQEAAMTLVEEAQAAGLAEVPEAPQPVAGENEEAENGGEGLDPAPTGDQTATEVAGDREPAPEDVPEHEPSLPQDEPQAGSEDELVEVLEEQEEEQDSDDGRAWFVVHCYSGQENKVRHNLEQRIESMGMKDRIFDVVVPTEEEIEVKDGKRRTVERRVFPGYILVQMILDEDSWYVVRNTPGVTGFVGMGNEPTPLRPEEVSQIIKRMEAEAPRIKVTYKIGQKVRIIDGPFNDFIGTVDDIDMERAKVRVMVSFFGRETPVELDFLQVEKA